MNLRIKKYPRGYVAEIKKRTWYGRVYWTHFISAAGLPDCPWHFKTFDFAIEEALREVEWNIIKNN